MDFKKELKEVERIGGKLVKSLPEEAKGFNHLHDVALEDGALGMKEKELIALGISIAIKCEPCIMSHVATLVELGATRDEIVETIGVAFFMGGGPGMAYGAKALECYDQLSE